MRCKSCDEVLTDWEATRKVEETREYLELCNECFNNDVLTIDRPDLMHIEDDKPVNCVVGTPKGAPPLLGPNRSTSPLVP